MSTNRLIAITLKGGISFIVPMLILLSGARADCGQWDLSGPWRFTQGESAVSFDLQQTGNTISGTGQYVMPQREDQYGLPMRRQANPGTVKGTIDGSNFRFTATWEFEAIGEYSGVVDAQGRISGQTYDKNDPEVTASWQGDHAAKCLKPDKIKPLEAHLETVQCESGYVWRDNFDGDTVCVKPDERHRLANGTCSPGYVWRDTFDGDNVCVTPAQREAAKAQKRRDELGEVGNRPGAAGMSH
jgi:hypothetical protein